ncbi:Dyp-type peroxidase [soil metagenome]
MPIDLTKPLAWKRSRSGLDPNSADELAMLLDLQGNILKGHGRHFTSNIFIGFDDKARVAQARSFVASVGFDVTPALEQLIDAEDHKATGADAGNFFALMISASGYEALGKTGNKPAGVAFDDGMGKRLLNDPLPGTWEAPFQDAHAMILIGASDGPTRDNARDAMIKRIASTGGAVVVRGNPVDGNALFNDDGRGIEHFGYVDGRSQPLPLQEDVDEERQNGGIDKWNPAIPLEQVLVQCPGGTSKLSHGSFFVFRKLEQDVSRFKNREEALRIDLDNQAGAAGGPHTPVGERAGASVVGRFENGTPVTLDEDEIPLATKSDAAVRNNFNYADDQAGLKCPYAGHIRKTNPRSDAPNSKTHLMARRGIPFGTRADGPNDGLRNNKPSGGVGLLFMAYQASLESQFEFTQMSWVNEPRFAQPIVKPGPDTGIDPVIGQPDPSKLPLPGQFYPMDWDGRMATTRFDFHGFVKMQGGEYFFAPSISFLKSL